MSATPKPWSFEQYQPPNITLPLGTLSIAVDEMSDMSGMLDRIQMQMVVTLLSTISVGIYTICAAYAAKILIGRDPPVKGNRRKLLAVTVAMYTATFVYWVSSVVGQFRTLRALMRHLSSEISWLNRLTESLIPASQCLPGMANAGDRPVFCTSVQPPRSWILMDGWAITQGDCAGTATLTFNVVLGDAIVWWRVWVLWNKNRLILAVCCGVLLATLGCGMADSINSCALGPVIWNTSVDGTNSNSTELGAFFGGNIFGLAAIVLSLFSNTLATLLVGYKAWRHRLRASKHFSRVPGVIRVQRALMLLVESGIAYCILWALVLSSNLSTIIPGPQNVELSNGLQRWTKDMLYFTEGCLVTFVGIYPTLIIALVALDKSEIEKQSLAYSIPVTRGLQSSPVRVEVAMDVGCTADSDARVDPHMRPHSVILIGPPGASSNGSSTQLSEVKSEDLAERAKTER